jgi:outer membrane protein assembly factor BamB
MFNQLIYKSMKHFPTVLVCMLICLFSQKNYAQKIYQWRGDNREGIYHETNLLKKWPDKGPELLWFNQEIGVGYAAPVIVENKILINGESNGTSYLFAFDLKGKLLWKTANGKEFYGKDFSANYPGSRSTPTVVGDLIYITSGMGRLACYELSSGKEKWAVDMAAEMGGLVNEFGYSESPLVDGDVVFCMPGGPENNVVALNRLTGKTIWTSKAMKDTTSFCSPMIINLAERKVFVSLSHHYIFGLDAKNGELLWSQKLEKFKYDGEHCNTPVFSNGYLYYTTAEDDGNGTVKLEISPDGKSIKEIWRNKTAQNGFGGFVLVDDHLFETTKQKRLICLDTNTGSVLDSLSANSGSIVYADNMIYSYSQNGDVKLIQFANNKFKEISKFKIDKGTKEHFAHPVISNGVMYIRHGNAFMAYKI